MSIAIYIGWLSANTARAIARIPINNTSIDVNVDILVTWDNNPETPNIIIINPTIQNCNPMRNGKASIQNMNKNPNMIAIIPMMIVAVEKLS